MEIEPQPQIFDADESNFEELIIRGSEERVIVIDFWAPWCGPCKTLGPIIEEVVTSLNHAAGGNATRMQRRNQ